MAEERVPPHSSEAEEAVLGAMLLDAQALPKVMEILNEGNFYSPLLQIGSNRTRYSTILADPSIYRTLLLMY
jgi:hypothetical protein